MASVRSATFSDCRRQRRQVAAAAAICGTVALVFVGLLLGWRHIPGLAGESLGTFVGLISTPIILEVSFLILGFTIVIALNVWHRQREGDEFVFLDQVDGPDVPADLPEHARWAVCPADAPPGEEPTLLARAEGALEVGDADQSAAFLAEMTDAELRLPETLRLRARLARVAGRHELADRLEREIDEAGTEARGVQTTR